MTDVTEHEAIARFVEGVKEAASAIRLMENTKAHPEQPKIFSKAMRVAAGSAHQLFFMQDNPDFLVIRDQLETLSKQGIILAVNDHIGTKLKATHGVSPFQAVSNMLLSIAEIGSRLATSKSVSRKTALEAVDMRVAQQAH